jgi:serine/threonine protein kinase
VGTDGYIAPEAYLGDVCPKSDVFSTGVVMYLLIAGRYPFDSAIFDDGPNENYVGSPKMAEIYDKLQRYKVRFGRPFDPYPEAKDLCMRMLEFDPDKRPDAAEALQHPWFLAQDVRDARYEDKGTLGASIFSPVLHDEMPPAAIPDVRHLRRDPRWAGYPAHPRCPPSAGAASGAALGAASGAASGAA